MRERRTGDSFWTRRSCRPVKRTYFLCVDVWMCVYVSTTTQQRRLHMVDLIR